MYYRVGDGEVIKSAQGGEKKLHEKQVPLKARITLCLVRGRQEREPKIGRFISPIA